MLFVNQPYLPNKELGKAYNEFMERLKDDDWACFLDHDACFTTRHWYDHLWRAITKYPDAGFFTCCTNRVWNPWQRIEIPRTVQMSNDLAFHRHLGELIEAQFEDVIELIPADRELMSGMCFVVSKKVWKEIKFTDGMLGVDNLFHRRVNDSGLEVYLIKSLYVYHWYRADGIMP